MTSTVKRSTSQSALSDRKLQYNKLSISNLKFTQKGNMWIKGLLNINNQNIFTTVHGDPQGTDKLHFIVPDNVILVFITPRSQVIFSDPTDDLESLIYLKNPNWFKSNWSDIASCSGADVPVFGFSKPKSKDWDWDRGDEPAGLKTFEEQVSWARMAEKKKGTPQGSKNILNFANVFFPGDSCYNQKTSYTDDVDFDAFLLGKPFTKAEASKAGDYRKLYHKQIIEKMKPVFSNKSGMTTTEHELRDAEDDLQMQFYQSGYTDSRPPIALKSTYEGLEGDYVLPNIWNFAETFKNNKNQPFKEIVKKMNSVRQGDYQPTLKTTEDFVNYISIMSSEDSPRIIYFNSCSPSHTQRTLKKSRDSHEMRGKLLLSIQGIRSNIQKIGRENFCTLRATIPTLRDFPTMFASDLPRHTHGYARMTRGDRGDWYANHIGHYFKMLRETSKMKKRSNQKKVDYIGLKVGEEWDAQKTLNDLYEEAKSDQSGRTLPMLYKRFNAEKSNHLGTWLAFLADKKIKAIPVWNKEWYKGSVSNEVAVVGGKRKRATRKKRKKKIRKKTTINTYGRKKKKQTRKKKYKHKHKRKHTRRRR